MSISHAYSSSPAGRWAGITPPAILGYDVSGEVAAVSEEVHNLHILARSQQLSAELQDVA